MRTAFPLVRRGLGGSYTVVTGLCEKQVLVAKEVLDSIVSAEGCDDINALAVVHIPRPLINDSAAPIRVWNAGTDFITAKIIPGWNLPARL